MQCSFKKFTATLTSIAIMSSIAVGTAGSAYASVAPPSLATMAVSSTLSVQKAKILEFEGLINEFRAENGIAPLKFNATAATEAYNWSKYMGQTGNYRHAAQQDYYAPTEGLYRMRSENIAWSTETDVSGMFNQWKTSLSHRAAMLNPASTSFGIAFYTGSGTDKGAGKMYGTTIFHDAKADYMPETYDTAASYFSDSAPIATTVAKLKSVSPAPATFNATANTYTVPTTVGVRYYNLGSKKFVPAGTHPIYNPTTTIVPIAQDGYRLSSGDAGWRFVKPADPLLGAYDVQEPQFYDSATQRGIHFRNDAVVDYYINGVKAPTNGFNNITSNVRVVVTAKIKDSEKDFYYLNDYHEPWVWDYSANLAFGKTVTIDGVNAKYTIPSAEGVAYKVNGVVKAAGTYTATAGQTLNFEAVGTSGYVLEYSQNFKFAYTFPVTDIAVTATAPTFNTTNWTYTVPAKTGVTYRLNGVAKAAGTYDAPSGQSVSITAHAASGYALSGTATWSANFPVKTTAVTATAPTFNATNMEYTIPSQTGVNYRVDGVIKAAGTYATSANSSVVVTAHASSGYHLNGTATWTGVFGNPPLIVVVPSAPTFNANGFAYTVPTKAGVVYKVNGVVKAAGTYTASANSTVNISAVAASGYAVTGTNSWTVTYGSAPLTSVATVAPTSNAAAGTYVIPSKTGINYYANGVLKAAGTYSSGYQLVAITAKAKTGYVLSGTASWNLDLRKKTVIATNPSVNYTTKTIVLPRVTGVNYYIDGYYKAPGSHLAYTTVKVTAKASAANYNVAAKTWTYDMRTAVAPTKPTFDAGRNTVYIPSKFGVDYYINGVKKAKGTYSYASTGTVTTKASFNTYKLSGTQSWKFDNRNVVTPTTPTFNASTNKVYIPAKTGVVYYINGVKKAKGTYSYTSTGTVTAKASTSSYRLSGIQSWKFDNRNVVTPTKPTFNASQNTVYIPYKAGVIYYINGVQKSKGTYKYTGTGKVTTKASSSYYRLSGTQSWSFDNRNSVSPKAPSSSASRNTVTIPKVTGVNYYINGAYKSSGTHRYNGYGTVTTRASHSSYKLSGTQSWKFDNRNVVIPSRPSFNYNTNKVVIPAKTGVVYYINGVKKGKGTYTYTSTGTVTAKASSGYYRLSGTQLWRFDNRNAVTPSAPGFNASTNKVYIPAKTGVVYYINGVKKVKGTYTYTGTVKVTTKASSSYYRLTGTTSWSARL